MAMCTHEPKDRAVTYHKPAADQWDLTEEFCQDCMWSLWGKEDGGFVIIVKITLPSGKELL